MWRRKVHAHCTVLYCTALHCILAKLQLNCILTWVMGSNQLATSRSADGVRTTLIQHSQFKQVIWQSSVRYDMKLQVRISAFTWLNSLYSTSDYFTYSQLLQRSRDSAVGVATGYGLDDRGIRVRVPVGSRIFSSGALSPGVKWPGREADHSPPTSAEVKRMWIYTSTPPYAFVA
jgi:hypothetical protein